VKRIDGQASRDVDAPAERCFALLVAVDGYADWTGGLVRDIEVLAWAPDDRPAKARATIHVVTSALTRDLRFAVAVRAQPTSAVTLVGLPDESPDFNELEIAWLLSPSGPGATRIAVSFHALTGVVPRFLPLPGVGDLVARALLDPAVETLSGRGTSASGSG
jgi:hypothetical protein